MPKTFIFLREYCNQQYIVYYHLGRGTVWEQTAVFIQICLLFSIHNFLPIDDFMPPIHEMTNIFKDLKRILITFI